MEAKEEIAISKFKATCLAVLDKVKRTGQPVIVTKRGRPVAEIVPLSTKAAQASWLGSMRGTGKLVGDIVSPASDETDWEVLAS